MPFIHEFFMKIQLLIFELINFYFLLVSISLILIISIIICEINFSYVDEMFSIKIEVIIHLFHGHKYVKCINILRH